MGNGMVRKVDELGRVVIPKEMRRILNIKTGSSIEMFINDQNQVVLKKFSELENVNSFIQTLVETIYDVYSVPCFVCDDEKVLAVCGLSKKEFLDRPIEYKESNFNILEISLKSLLKGVESEQKCFVFSIVCEGFESGKLAIVTQNFEEEKKQSISMLLKYLCGLLSF